MAIKKRPAHEEPPARFDDPSVVAPLARARKSGPVDEKVAAAAELAKRLIKGKGKQRASMVDLAEAGVAAFRGAQGIAARMRVEYEHSPAGSKQRLEYMKMVKDMVKDLKENEERASVSSLTDEEIENEIISILSGMSERDGGSPKTTGGKMLLESALLQEGEEEFAELESEMRQLDQSHEIDKIAADILQDSSNKSMVEKGLVSAVVPPEEEEEGDVDDSEFENIEYEE